MDRFASSATRRLFHKSIINILDFAAQNRAASVLVGGSFVTDKENPTDLDCVIVFRTAARIPQRRESLDIEGKGIDVFFASLDQPAILRAFLRLFSSNRFEEKVGAVEIAIQEGSEPVWDITWEDDDSLFEVVKRAYIDRHFVDKIDRGKALVTIHGLRTHAEWNAEITLIASANGWLVAPFHYGFVQPTVLARSKERGRIVDQFRDFLADLRLMFGVEVISVVAHSFGTYIACKYLLGFEHPPTTVDTLILTGAIVDENLDLERFANKAALIVNEVAPNDEWVELAKFANFRRDELFGDAGTKGFRQQTARLAQTTSDIFSHTNVIKRDIVSQRWMPLLEANVGAVRREGILSLIAQSRDSRTEPSCPTD
jgi:pimeloyl-ACP methyl ester carboxylesterase